MSKVKFTSISNFDGFEGMLNGELLWTNANPTSNFLAQTINLDLSKYKLIFITFKWGTTSNNTLLSTLSDNITGFSGGVANGTYNGRIYRDYVIAQNGIEFHGGYQGVWASNTISVDNSVCIPFKIYGLN